MYKLAVVGNPIEHSLSPVVFGLFAKEFALDLSYTKILAIDAPDFKVKVNNFFTDGGLSLNITSPFKNLAFSTATMHTPRARLCNAVNFIRKQDNELLADTVDGLGLVEDVVSNLKFKIQGKRVLIVGSGFVVDSILLDLIVQNPVQISILARNQERVAALRSKFATTTFDPLIDYDIVFNSTPNSATNVLFASITHLADEALCYDLTYNKDSIFLAKMQQLNPTIYTRTGLGMLVEQAKIAFTTLFKYKPDTASVLRKLAIMGHN